MNRTEVNQLLAAHDGNHSLLYPRMKDKLRDYTDEELPFPGEFLFFEDRYLRIRRHMLDHGIKAERIVDIGCEYGFQSEIFPEWSYLGIDQERARFFNQQRANVTYQVGTYPRELNPDITNSVVISCMSLGYFKGSIFKHLTDDEMHRMLVDALGNAKHLYIATTPRLRKDLEKRFNHRVMLEESIQESFNGKRLEFGLWYMTNI